MRCPRTPGSLRRVKAVRRKEPAHCCTIIVIRLAAAVSCNFQGPAWQVIGR